MLPKIILRLETAADQLIPHDDILEYHSFVVPVIGEVLRFGVNESYIVIGREREIKKMTVPSVEEEFIICVEKITE